MISSKIQENEIWRKYRICEKDRAKSLQSLLCFLLIMFIHALLTWIPKKRCLVQIFIIMLNALLSIYKDLKLLMHISVPMNKEILEKFFGNSIKFCESDRKNQSSMVFSSSMNLTDVINTLWSLNGVKSAGQTIRENL